MQEVGSLRQAQRVHSAAHGTSEAINAGTASSLDRSDANRVVLLSLSSARTDFSLGTQPGAPGMGNASGPCSKLFDASVGRLPPELSALALQPIADIAASGEQGSALFPPHQAALSSTEDIAMESDESAPGRARPSAVNAARQTPANSADNQTAGARADQANVAWVRLGPGGKLSDDAFQRVKLAQVSGSM